jgi:dTMP kinase
VRRGRFIVIEGIDGAGTTSQSERLGRALRQEGRKVLTTREPSGGPVGVLLRQALTGRVTLPGGGAWSAQTLALLFAADRKDHLEAEVEPALEGGQIVICDRYLLSSLAYQGLGVSMAWVESLNAHALRPDLTLFLHVPPRVAAARREARGGAPELFDSAQAQRRIARQYEVAIRRRARKDRIRTLDGTLSMDEVSALVLASVRAELGSRK